jgi:hypothetical protein
MSLTLKEFIETAENFRVKSNKKTNKNLADDLLGKYEGIVPEGRNSSEYLSVYSVHFKAAAVKQVNFDFEIKSCIISLEEQPGQWECKH